MPAASPTPLEEFLADPSLSSTPQPPSAASAGTPYVGTPAGWSPFAAGAGAGSRPSQGPNRMLWLALGGGVVVVLLAIVGILLVSTKPSLDSGAATAQNATNAPPAGSGVPSPSAPSGGGPTPPSPSTPTTSPSGPPPSDQGTSPPSPAPVPAHPPRLAAATSLELVFEVTGDLPSRITGIEAFATTWPGQKRPIAVTALTHFNRPNSFVRIDAGQLANSLDNGRVIDAETGREVCTVTGVVPILGRTVEIGGRSVASTDVADDLVAFYLPEDAKVGLLPLASEAAKVGDPAWLLRAPDKSGAAAPQLQRCTIRMAKEKVLVYQLDNDIRPPTFAEGTPLVNSAGEVVALHAGSAQGQGRIIGLANPVANLRGHLQRAIGR